MSKSFINQFSANLILALSVLLVFLLIFDSYLYIPDLIGYFGRLHPVILHFPIVLILLVVINSFTRYKPYQKTLLFVATLSALLTAISGFLLSEEMTSKGGLLVWHQWLGSVVALLMTIWFGFENSGWNKLRITILLRLAIVILIVTTGHFGGMVTHGSDFLAWTSKSKESVINMPENPLVFEHLVIPVLKSKCIACHNPDKSKGGLILSDYEAIMRGGETGCIIAQGDPDNSEVIRRIFLPLDDDDHMPPSERNQLTEHEKQLLEGWITLGALKELHVAEVNQEDLFFKTLQSFLTPDESARWNHLPEVAETLIQKISSDYCTIRRISEKSNALSVVIFPHSNYEQKGLSFLKTISKNIVELDLGNLPLSDDEVKFISECESLEWLGIDYSTIDDARFNMLGDLKNLRVLKAQGSSLTDNSLQTLLKFKGLEKLFIWETGLSEIAVNQIKSSNPKIDINTGINKNITFTSTLPVPTIDPDQPFFIDPITIRFDHPLKEIDILFTLDGIIPGPDASVFSNSLAIDHSCNLKFLASKEGWENSAIDSIRFFKTSKSPDHLTLQYSPDPKYMGNGQKALFDLKKGTFNLNDSAWLGFQKNKMVLFCQWEKELILKSITLSSLINTGIHVFPPVSIEVEGGNNLSGQILLGSLYPEPVNSHERPTFNFLTCSVDSQPVTRLTITVTPLEKLPDWHDAKGKPGWFFIDEVILEN